MKTNYLRSECHTCLSWDVPKNVCLRVMHGMACVVAPPQRGSLVDPLPRDFAAGATDNAIAKNYVPKARDTQVGGDHYKKMGVEPWDVVDTWPLEQRIGYYRGGALKYIMRMGAKDQTAQEIAKGKHYIEKLLEVLQAEDDEQAAVAQGAACGSIK
jgi:hypothetical protein